MGVGWGCLSGRRSAATAQRVGCPECEQSPWLCSIAPDLGSPWQLWLRSLDSF